MVSEESIVRIDAADFIAGAASYDALPKTDCFEVAIVGRSNVGKSTFINRICQRKKLARTSRTPGRTAQINLFQVDYRIEQGRIDQGRIEQAAEGQVIIADLPGYGFAKRSKAERASLRKLIEAYLTGDRQLGLLCLLTDIRRGPEEEELALQELARESEIPLLVVLTKSDTLSRVQATEAMRAAAQAYHLDPSDLLASGEGQGNLAFWQRVALLNCQ